MGLDLLKVLEVAPHPKCLLVGFILTAGSIRSKSETADFGLRIPGLNLHGTCFPSRFQSWSVRGPTCPSAPHKSQHLAYWAKPLGWYCNQNVVGLSPASAGLQVLEQGP